MCWDEGAHGDSEGSTRFRGPGSAGRKVNGRIRVRFTAHPFRLSRFVKPTRRKLDPPVRKVARDSWLTPHADHVRSAVRFIAGLHSRDGCSKAHGIERDLRLELAAFCLPLSFRQRLDTREVRCGDFVDLCAEVWSERPECGSTASLKSHERHRFPGFALTSPWVHRALCDGNPVKQSRRPRAVLVLVSELSAAQCPVETRGWCKETVRPCGMLGVRGEPSHWRAGAHAQRKLTPIYFTRILDGTLDAPRYTK